MAATKCGALSGTVYSAQIAEGGSKRLKKTALAFIGGRGLSAQWLWSGEKTM